MDREPIKALRRDAIGSGEALFRSIAATAPAAAVAASRPSGAASTGGSLPTAAPTTARPFRRTGLPAGSAEGSHVTMTEPRIITVRPEPDRYAWTFGGAAAPARIAPGTVLALDTKDCFAHRVRSETRAERTSGSAGATPAVPCLGSRGSSTGMPDAHGGNMATPEIRASITCDLGVNAEGALLGLGDGHARSARPLEDAFRISQLDLVEWLVRDYGFSELDAHQSATQAVESPLAAVCDTNYTCVAKPRTQWLPARETYRGVHARLPETARTPRG